MRRCGALAALAVAALAPCAALEPAAALSAAAGADALTPPALPAGCGGRAECEPERWLREQQALNTVIVALLALTGGAVLVIAIVRFACCPVARPATQPPRAARGSRPPLELLPLRRVDSWQVGPAVLTELPDGTMVAALPRSAKTGALRGRSFWGSGGGWSDALAGLRAHWPGAGRDDEAARAATCAAAASP